MPPSQDPGLSHHLGLRSSPLPPSSPRSVKDENQTAIKIVNESFIILETRSFSPRKASRSKKIGKLKKTYRPVLRSLSGHRDPGSP